MSLSTRRTPKNNPKAFGHGLSRFMTIERCGASIAISLLNEIPIASADGV
jgi:hypothetical protein